MSGVMTWSLVGPDGQPTDDFRFDDRGRFVQDDTVATAITLALDHHLGKWWADPHHGSRFAELIAGTPTPDLDRELESATREALAPLERQGRIKNIEISAEMQGNRARISIRVFDTGRAKPVAMEVVRP